MFIALEAGLIYLFLYSPSMPGDLFTQPTYICLLIMSFWFVKHHITLQNLLRVVLNPGFHASKGIPPRLHVLPGKRSCGLATHGRWVLTFFSWILIMFWENLAFLKLLRPQGHIAGTWSNLIKWPRASASVSPTLNFPELTNSIHTVECILQSRPTAY